MIPESRVIGQVALTFFRKGLRGRLGLLLTTAFLAIPLVGTLFARFELDRRLEERLALEAGLLLAAVVILVTAIVSGATGLGTGDDTRALQPFLTLPVPRRAIVIGHSLGVSSTLALYSAVLALSLGAVLEARFSGAKPALAVHFLTLFLEATLLAGLASVLAQVGSTLFAYLATASVALMAHASGMLQHLSSDPAQAILSRLMTLVVLLTPDLGGMDVRSSVVLGDPVPWQTLLPAIGHSFLYLLVLLLLSMHLFEKREMA